MVKRVVSSDQVAHLWANQSQDEARNGCRSVSFDGTWYYSYRTVVAAIYRVEGGPVALFTSRSYSVTTSGHVSSARGAWHNHGRSFTVPDVDVPTSQRNVEYLRGQVTEAIAKAKTCQFGSWSSRLEDDGRPRFIHDAEGRAARGQAYCETFGLEWISLQPEIDAACDVYLARLDRKLKAANPRDYAAALERAGTAQAARVAILADQRRKAEEEREAARKVAEARRYAELADARSDWLAGGRGHSWVHLSDERGGALLRVKDDTLETSWGADVPLEHAIRVFKLVCRVRDAGTTWERDPAAPFRVGHFTVDRIDPSGDFTAGCHRIHWSEVERIATSLGLLAEAA